MLCHGKLDRVSTAGFLRKTAVLQMQSIFQETCDFQVLRKEQLGYQYSPDVVWFQNYLGNSLCGLLTWVNTVQKEIYMSSDFTIFYTTKISGNCKKLNHSLEEFILASSSCEEFMRSVLFTDSIYIWTQRLDYTVFHMVKHLYEEFHWHRWSSSREKVLICVNKFCTK